MSIMLGCISLDAKSKPLMILTGELMLTLDKVSEKLPNALVAADGSPEFRTPLLFKSWKTVAPET